MNPRRAPKIALTALATSMLLTVTAPAHADDDVLTGSRTAAAPSVPILPGWYLSPLTYYSGGYSKGAATAHGSYPVSKLTVFTWLYRKRFYGWQPLDSDTSKDTDTRRVSSISRKKCSGKYTYKVSAKATAVYKGKTYRASNSAKRRYKCR